jgi:hypothetical protein
MGIRVFDLLGVYTNVKMATWNGVHWALYVVPIQLTSSHQTRFRINLWMWAVSISYSVLGMSPVVYVIVRWAE